MKTKILLGSIGAVAILILVSFTNVVGVQSTSSGSVNESPLFRIRTTRANSENSKDALTSNYLGKGLNAIQFPLRDNRTALIQRFVDGIRTMDEPTFNRFVDFAVNQINHKNNLKVVNIEEFIKELRQMRESTQNIVVNKDSDVVRFTILSNYNPVDCWFPGKLLLICMAIPLAILLFLFFLFFADATYMFPCHIGYNLEIQR
ncbi:MAG: hypothetical protein IMZ47_09585 [Firmicutes bacterium]|nr:hypothetical protein [Bacillota bacterium]